MEPLESVGPRPRKARYPKNHQGEFDQKTKWNWDQNTAKKPTICDSTCY